MSFSSRITDDQILTDVDPEVSEIQADVGDATGLAIGAGSAAANASIASMVRYLTDSTGAGLGAAITALQADIGAGANTSTLGSLYTILGNPTSPISTVLGSNITLGVGAGSIAANQDVQHMIRWLSDFVALEGTIGSPTSPAGTIVGDIAAVDTHAETATLVSGAGSNANNSRAGLLLRYIADNLSAAVLTTAASSQMVCGVAGSAAFAAWAALTNTAQFDIVVDGQQIACNPNFTGDGSMADVAASIQTALQVSLAGTLCAWSTDHFVITSPKTGNISSVSELDTPLAGVDISGTAWMNGQVGYQNLMSFERDTRQQIGDMHTDSLSSIAEKLGDPTSSISSVVGTNLTLAIGAGSAAADQPIQKMVRYAVDNLATQANIGTIANSGTLADTLAASIGDLVNDSIATRLGTIAGSAATAAGHNNPDVAGTTAGLIGALVVPDVAGTAAGLHATTDAFITGHSAATSYNYTDAGGEQVILTLSPGADMWLIHSIWLDLSTMTQNGTIKVYYKIDGTNYTLVSSDVFTVATDPDGFCINTGSMGITDDLKVTYTESVDEAAIRAIPVDAVYEIR